MKPSVKTITVRTLLSVILVAGFIMTIIIGLGFRDLSHKIVKDQAVSAAELLKAGLTSHMKSETMDKRDYFLAEINSLENINSIKIIRSKEINNQFGTGRKLEEDMDTFSRSVFISKRPAFKLNEFGMTPHIRAVVPLIASKEGNGGCIKCHKVKEGTVLGAVDIEMDLTKYRNVALTVLTIIAGLSLLFVGLIIFNTFRTVQQHVTDPLESLINKAKEAYMDRKPVKEEDFKSQEFENVAKEINLFNADIVKNHILLEEKNEELMSLNDEIEETLRETVFAMGVIEEKRSKETNNHTRRVTEYCKLLATKLDLPEREIALITAAAPLHDIGKIGISDYILLKSSELTDEEFEIMKSHTKLGYSMLIHSKRAILQAAAIVSSQHHEKWDGTGYPERLKGEEIHIFGRIAAIADVFDALSTKRPYKEAWPIEKTMAHFKENKAKYFDPALVDILFDNIDDFKNISKQYT